MGTRSLTFVYTEDNKKIICMYRQYDGYPTDHGAELAEFLKDMVVVKGFNDSTPTKAANGMECLAAQLVAHFKTGIGGIYLYPVTVKDADQEYEYHIYKDNLIIKEGFPPRFKKIYDGPWASDNLTQLILKG
jgi:hypothetical protein